MSRATKGRRGRKAGGAGRAGRAGRAGGGKGRTDVGRVFRPGSSADLQSRSPSEFRVLGSAVMRTLSSWLLVLLITMLPAAGLTRMAAQNRAGEEGGELPDGTQYLMKVPANWNGTLIRDLDYASGANAPRWAAL